VAIESFEEEYDENDPNERRHVSISAAILCDKSTHKGMIIGKQGQKLKDIGSRARKEIEEMLGCSCYLKLFVKVREDWRNRNGILNDLGYDSRES
jgi:GTP-binding protein Era